jgi:hypothetical protein
VRYQYEGGNGMEAGMVKQKPDLDDLIFQDEWKISER